jgi:hypothetical protein
MQQELMQDTRIIRYKIKKRETDFVQEMENLSLRNSILNLDIDTDAELIDDASSETESAPEFNCTLDSEIKTRRFFRRNQLTFRKKRRACLNN